MTTATTQVDDDDDDDGLLVYRIVRGDAAVDEVVAVRFSVGVRRLKVVRRQVRWCRRRTYADVGEMSVLQR